MLKKCPICKGEISSKLPNDLPEKDLRFCPECGGNFRYNCPICDKDNQKNMMKISIMGIGEEIRCPDCKSLLYVCEKCERLVQPWLHFCPADGGCLKSPKLSSNNYDGTGFCDNYKIKLSSKDKKYKSESRELYANENDCSELYSARIVGCYLFVWHDTRIDVFDIDNNFNLVRSKTVPMGKKSNISRSMAVLADNIIIALEDKFLWFNLNGNEPIPIDDQVKGKPVGLIAGHCGVAMWTEDNGEYCLYTALCPEVNTKPIIKKVNLDSDKYQLMNNSSCLAMSYTALYWQGKNDSIYKYDFFNKNEDEPPKEIYFDKGKVDYIWVNHEKVSVAYSDSVQFYVCDLEGRNYEQSLSISDPNPIAFFIYKGKESQDYAYIFSDGIMQNGTGTYNLTNSEHVNSILCKEENGTLILLSMFRNIQFGNTFGNIFAMEKDSGSSETIWQGDTKIEPIEMLCFEDKIFVLHKKGVVVVDRIEDNSETSDTTNTQIVNNNFQTTIEENEEKQKELSIDTDFELNEDTVEPIQILQINKVVEIPNRAAEKQELIQKEDKPSLGFDFSRDEEDLPVVLENSSIIICPHCKAELPKDGTKFCSECGKPIEQEEDKPKDEKTKIEELLAKLKK